MLRERNVVWVVLSASVVAWCANGHRAAAEEAPDLGALVGKTVTIQLTNNIIDPAEIVKIQAGNGAGTIRGLTIKAGTPPKQQTIGAQLVTEIILDNEPLDVTFDKKTRQLAHDPEKRRKRHEKAEQVKAQLDGKRAKLWEQLTESQQAAFVDEEKAFLDKVGKASNIPMQLIETKFFLFYTDMPTKTVGVYVQYLDDMYNMLCKAFGFPPGKNIWRGKCVVLAFQTPASFHAFEATIMNNPNSQGAQGICHSFGSGRVVMACYKGSTVEFFATVLVHETAHGFMHRYKSTINMPNWIDEGVADWVAGQVVKADTEVKDRQRDAVAQIRQTGVLSQGFFAAGGRLERWEYGLASSMVELLLGPNSSSGPKYRELIDSIKEGIDPEEALRKAYGFGFVELAQKYGQAVGVPNVRPY
jgi:hypothetical protein